MTTRDDGHSCSSLRKLFLSFDTLSRVDGSARFGFGSVPQALVSLSGPIEVRLAAEQASQATLEIHLRPISNVPATESKFLSSSISSALTPSLILTQNPRTLIQIVIQTLVSSPKWKDPLVASMINACTLALMNAGSIPMKGIVCAVALGRARQDQGVSYVVDPTDEEAQHLTGGGCFAFLFSDFEPQSGATCVWTNWRRWDSESGFDEEEILTTRGMAREAAREVWKQVKKLVEEYEDPVRTGSIPLPQKKPMKIKGEMASEVEDDDAKMEI
ncbi:hypothetical protein L218DRAFT_367078 [Marasmius fiardii PR-910]|nr:hypothetical protein L218DRAFT_367078 [Marasmius fiardii PR-910]